MQPRMDSSSTHRNVQPQKKYSTDKNAQPTTKIQPIKKHSTYEKHSTLEKYPTCKQQFNACKLFKLKLLKAVNL